MARAVIEKELHFETKNETGMLGQVTVTLAVKGIYIIHLAAYAVGNKGHFHIITRQNAKAKEALKHLSPKIVERDVLVVEFENKVGTLAPVVKLLGSNRIDVDSVYGTAGDGVKIVGIFSTSNNKKAAELINKDSGALGV